jgi:cysteine desulfurase
MYKTKHRTLSKKKTVIKPCRKNIIYLDNNSTTKICKKGKDAMISWLDAQSNPSSNNIISKNSKQLLECATKYMLKHCGTNSKQYTLLFTSGASESNCLILLSVVDAYTNTTNTIPHIITSSVEHKSIITCCNNLVKNKRAAVSFIKPNAFGNIDPKLIERSIKPNTALVSIMFANNEIGCINNIKEIGRIVHSHKIPLHTDAVQIFGKYKISLPKHNIDAISMSFHKLYGPMGMGLLIISNDLIQGYGIECQIAGSQQSTLRGGTENVPAIAGSVSCMEDTFKNRHEKNKKLHMLKLFFISELEKKIPRGEYEMYFKPDKPKRNEFIILGPKDNNNIITPNVLPNTILISFVKNKGPAFCNVDLKKHLDKKNIIVSIGSACNTLSTSSSHVLSEIRAPVNIKQGVIRISLSDNTTLQEIDIAVKELIKSVTKSFAII